MKKVDRDRQRRNEEFTTAAETIAEQVLLNFSLTMQLNDVPAPVAAWAAIMAAATIAARANCSLTDDQAAREHGVEILIEAFAGQARRLVREPAEPNKGRMH
jgi:hypothetical protein